MTLIEWRENFNTGFPGIDFEHQELIREINDMFDAFLDQRAEGREDTAQVYLGNIYTKIESHFALEEQTMREQKYAGYAEHKNDHDQLLEDIRDMMDDPGDPADTEFGPRLATRVAAWFENHFATLDSRFHRH